MNQEPATIGLPQVMDRYHRLIEESLKLNFLVRDADLQKEKISELDNFLSLLRRLKPQAVERKQEDVANALFQFQCVLNSLKSVLNMWLALKSGEHQSAWDFLIDAQEYCSVALRIQTNGSWGISEHANHLSEIEHTIFPGFPYFLSPGIIEESGTCSICRVSCT